MTSNKWLYSYDYVQTYTYAIYDIYQDSLTNIIFMAEVSYHTENQK